MISPFVAPHEESANLEGGFRAYMAMPSPDNADITPFEFWKTHRTDFPNLSRAASRILSVPPGSGDVERAFSKLGYGLQ